MSWFVDSSISIIAESERKSVVQALFFAANKLAIAETS